MTGRPRGAEPCPRRPALPVLVLSQHVDRLDAHELLAGAYLKR